MRLTLCLGIIVLTGCASVVSHVPDVPPGWASMAQVTNLPAPVLRPAMTVSGNVTVLAWWNAPGTAPATGLTVAHIANGTPAQSVTLPLGHAPRTLTLYPDAGGAVQALWLDNGDLPGVTWLFGALIGSDLSLQRGPTHISTEDTFRYAAVALPSGALAVMWTAHTGWAAAPLYLQMIDVAGRPGNTVLIDKDARFPAMAVDEHGTLYAGWLEPQPDAIQTVEFAQYPGDLTALTAIASNNVPVPSATPIGVIAPGQTDILDSFALGIERGYGYLVWDDANVSEKSAGGTTSTVEALTFPLDQPGTARQVTIARNARWPSVANSPLPNADGALPVGLTVMDESNGIPAVAWLAKDIVVHTDRFGSSPDAAEQSTLAVTGNTLIAAWATLADTGAVTINLSAWPFEAPR